jgi:cytochrome c peroxidase
LHGEDGEAAARPRRRVQYCDFAARFKSPDARIWVVGAVAAAIGCRLFPFLVPLLMIRPTTILATTVLFAAPAFGGKPPGDAPWGPLPEIAPAPADNPTTPAKAALGKQLFFDPRLSGANSLSCASCHKPELAFADGTQWNKGELGISLDRNTPTCLNVGFYTSLFWDGRSASLEDQALKPIESDVEMNQSLDELERELNDIPGYIEQFRRVFDAEPNRRDVAKALAAYQRTLVAGRSPFDRYLLGDEDALSDDAKRGWELFRGEARCIECHNGPLLSDGKFHRMGVSEEDAGREKVTGDRDDRYRFRTPSLRNVARTGPYMHDGTLSSLDKVVTYYYRDAPQATTDGLPTDVPDLRGQSYSEIPYLVEFLESLSGEPPDATPPALPPGPGQPTSSNPATPE